MSFWEQRLALRPLVGTSCGWRRSPTWPATRATPACTAQRVGPADLPELVRRTAPGASSGTVPTGGDVRTVAAGGPPVPALDRIPAAVGGGWLLPHLRDRRDSRALARRPRPSPQPESPTLGLSHLQFEALLSAARASANPNDFALFAMLGLLGLRIFEATGADIDDLGEEHGHRVLRVVGKGTRTVLIPLPPAVGRAIDRAIDDRTAGPILLNTRGARMDRHAATRRLRRLAAVSVVRLPRMHPHMLRHTFVTTMLDAGVDLRDVQIAARHADPRTTMRYDRARNNLDRHPNYILAAYMASGT
ncbi:tyrosine-type recombinase/integrase [Actinomadura geliboluensis]